MTEKILVVDDNDDTRKMMARLLELESFAVVTAADGRAGLQMAASECPDLIITDINLPELSGIEMIKALRRQPEFGDVPIMALTAYGSNIASEALEAGADCAETKPIEIDSLIGSIQKLLAGSNPDGNPFDS
ncbi:MAG: response regulator [Blastocatellia bacterium]|nr:response regulator [Blastocatellia bacterium]